MKISNVINKYGKTSVVLARVNDIRLIDSDTSTQMGYASMNPKQIVLYPMRGEFIGPASNYERKGVKKTGEWSFLF